MDITRYLIHVWGDVNPIIKGPYKSNKTRNWAAKNIHHSEPDLYDGVFILDIINGRPQISAYTNGFSGE